MTIQKIRQPKLADVIVERLESMILEGSLLPGQKLPPERELAKQFDVSRPSVREAIQRLEAKTLITKRQGGGTYVNNNLQGSLSDPLFELISSTPETQFDLLEFRHALEGISAYYAALRGTEADFNRIKKSFDSILVCEEQDSDCQVEALFEFYLAIAEASHNLVIAHLVRAMQSLIKQNIEQNLQTMMQKPEVTAELNDYRQALMDAVMARDPESARAASHRHLAHIEDTLLQLSQEDSRMQRSLRRLHVNQSA